MRGLIALPPLLLMLTACAAQGPFPSLAPRPIERELAEERPPLPAPPRPDDPTITAQIADLIARARQGDAQFDTALAAARRAASGAGAAGSETWIDAQVAISRAEAARAPTVVALAELDRLGVARAAQPTSAADLERIRAASAEVQAMADRQHEQLETLRASLNPA